VLQRALAGKYAEARALLPRARAEGRAPAPGLRSEGARNERLSDEGGGGGPERLEASAGNNPGKFTLPELTGLLEGAGLRVGAAHGIRIFSSLLPGAGADPVAAEALRELEEAAAACPPLRDIATRLHVIAYK
jgi:hypothetical protein